MGDARRSALKDAFDEARRDAEAMATAAGGSLGRVVLMSNTYTPTQIAEDTYARIAGGVAQSSTLMRPSELTVTANATVRWEFIARK